MLSRLFFFSSRRRHTRYWRDWSSDVCSSDLTAFRIGGTVMWLRSTPIRKAVVGSVNPVHAPVVSGPWQTERRSEERRVGKGVDLGGRRRNKEKKEQRSAVGTMERSSKYSGAG